MTVKITSDRSAAVDQEYFWRPLGGRTHKVTRMWRCAECLKEPKQ